MSNTWKDLFERAWLRRKPITELGDTDSFRLFHGYDEGYDGLTIEKFGDVAVVEFKKDLRSEMPAITDALLHLHAFELIIAKGHQSLPWKLNDRIYPAHSTLKNEPYFSFEHKLKYHILPMAAHNCGLYLDARPVREWLLGNSEGRRILNLFAFTGSLGLAAFKGGAQSVTHLDKSADLVPRIQQSYAANALRFDQRDFLRGDIYRHLPRAIKYKQRFDGIILDPPPKVYSSPHAKNKPKGQDFAQLVKLCSKLLNAQGWLVAMFHRFDSSWDDHEKEIIKASEYQLSAGERFTSGIDFPESKIENKLRVSIFYKNT